MLQLLTETLAGLIKNREQQLILGGKVVMKQPRGDTGQVGNFLDGRGFNALLREDCIASGNQSCPIVRLVCPGFLLFCNCLVVHTNMITWKGTFVKILLANSKRWLGSSITQWVLRQQNESDELARVAVPRSRPQC